MAVALLFFAFTTIVAYYYMAETNIAYINRKVHRPWLTLALRIAHHGRGGIRRDPQRVAGMGRWATSAWA